MSLACFEFLGLLVKLVEVTRHGEYFRTRNCRRLPMVLVMTICLEKEGLEVSIGAKPVMVSRYNFEKKKKTN